ncbi:MAG: hypothetical protein EHM17_13690 [Verrucomicrobiaceae bacterium]|nr:MAG: hypothetical protein EHM17_13690 [Verrucomicrobiaceae bacterium]
MKSPAILTALSLSLLAADAAAQEVIYTNFIRQFQTPTNVVWDASSEVSPADSRESDLAINPGGARFELWTVANTSPPTSRLLDTAYVGTYVPVATVTIRSEDPYIIPRTRVDRPFYVDIEVTGLLNGASDPAASKAVKLTRHMQSYGVGGTGINLDRTQASLVSQSFITTNGPQTITVPAMGTAVTGPGSKIRGEERFTIFSIEDSRIAPDGVTYVVPETQIASKLIQIWPMADGFITGISSNQLVRYQLPQLTLTLNDLYPSSTTYVQVYMGEPQLGTQGRIVPGSAITINDSVPVSRVLVIDDYDEVFDEDGRWTMELVTDTPFGVERLAYVSFDLDRTIKVNGSFVTIE